MIRQPVPRDLFGPQPTETPEGIERNSSIDLSQPALTHPVRYGPSAHVKARGKFPRSNAIDGRVSEFSEPELDVRIQSMVRNLFRMFPAEGFHGVLRDSAGCAS
jgi:hypothetical protein